MKQFSIKKNLLKAAAAAAANNDPRYYINGVFLDKETGEIKATDGHVLCIIQHEELKEIDEDIFIPNIVLGAVLKDRESDIANIEIREDCIAVGALEFKKPDTSDFPKTQRIEEYAKDPAMIEDVINQNLAIDISLIKKLDKCQKSLGFKHPIFFSFYLSNKNKDGGICSILFKFKNCRFYIMPTRAPEGGL